MAIDVLCHLTDDAAWQKVIAVVADLVKRDAVGIIIDRIEAERVQYQDYVLHRTFAEYRYAVSLHAMSLEEAHPRCFLVRRQKAQ